ncbi:MAG: GNAT family N-acetyltransferase [Burkholderiales bacterium]|nr:MAG: GNAT family N-acetyltransferase [Burkholderiales bacterium]
MPGSRHTVHRLGESDRTAFYEHLRTLSAEDRRLRFGQAINDWALEAYIDDIDFAADAVFAVLDDDLSIAGAAHLALRRDIAELGISVAADRRGRGVASALFDRVVVFAQNRGRTTFFMHCLIENRQMLRIAQRAGMRVASDATEADACLSLPAPTPLSLIDEAIADQYSLYDYGAKQLLQVLRAGMRRTDAGP